MPEGVVATVGCCAPAFGFGVICAATHTGVKPKMQSAPNAATLSCHTTGSGRHDVSPEFPVLEHLHDTVSATATNTP
jgi:hypothetical protein